MGLIRANITLANPSNGKLRPVAVTALVDAGATHLCIPQHVAVQLKLKDSISAKLPLRMASAASALTLVQLRSGLRTGRVIPVRWFGR
jgi:hypothetical protein